MHSMPVAEPVGAVAGVVGGAIGTWLGRTLARELGAPDFVEILCVTAGATAGHYLASTGTKLAVNVVMLDPLGAAASVGVTSPATALVHGGYVFSRLIGS